MPTQVIISSCPQDEKVLKGLITHLKAAGPAVLAACWSHLSVLPGERRAGSFAQALSTAKVAVLLVTQDYLADEQTRVELQQLLDLAKSGAIRLIPVPIRAVDWGAQPFALYQSVWSPDRPLASLKGPAQDNAYVTLARLIIDVVSAGDVTATHEPPAKRDQPQSVTEAQDAPPKWATFKLKVMAVFASITATGALFGAVVDVAQLINLPLALLITAAVSVAWALRYVGPWRVILRQNPTWAAGLAAVLVLVWGGFYYNRSRTPGPQRDHTISITVLDGMNRLVYDADVVSPLGTITKESGRYLLTLKRPGQPFVVRASRGPEEKGETLVDPGVPTAEIHLTATPAVYTLRISVVDETGKPVPQADLTTPVGELKRSGTLWEVTIAAAVKPSEPFDILATAEGGLAGTVTVALTDKNQVVKIQMKRDTSAILDGKVVDHTNQPIKGAAVMIEGYESEPQITDENGRFSLKAHKAKGSWVRVIVQPSGHAAFNQFVEITDELVTLIEKD